MNIFGKDGSTTTYTIKSFVANTAIADSKFTFDKTKHPKFEIVDLRD